MSIEQTPAIKADLVAYLRAGTSGRACVSLLFTIVVFVALVAPMSDRLPSDATIGLLILVPLFVVVLFGVEASLFLAFTYPRGGKTGPRIVHTPGGRLMTELLRPAPRQMPKATDLPGEETSLSKTILAAALRRGRSGGAWLNLFVALMVSDYLATWMFPGHAHGMSGIIIRMTLALVMISVESLASFGVRRVIKRRWPKIDLTRC